MKKVFPDSRQLFNNRVFQHILFWFICLLGAFGIMSIQSPRDIEFSLMFMLGLMVPMIIPVYLNFIALNTLFLKKKQLYYFLSVPLIFFISERLIHYLLFRLLGEEFTTFLPIPIILTMVVLTTSIKFLKKNYYQSQLMKDIQSKQVQTELQLLKSQINPHFLYNTLNNLYGLALNNSEKTAESILRLSGLMRYNLEGTKNSYVRLSEEINYIKSYIELEKLRLRNAEKITLEIKGEVDDLLISPLLLASLVENAFKHGASANNEEIVISIKLEVEGDSILFAISNSCNPDYMEGREGTGIGLPNLQKRLDMLYPSKHSLYIDHQDHKYDVVLQLILPV